jgi:choline dehydrogenase-like flavoprotein
MKTARPDQHFAMPTARARVATENRPACCASFRCQLCPVDAKFTANNGLMDVFSNPAVTLCLKTRAARFESDASAVQRLVVEHAGREHKVSGDLFVLGANAIQSPALLLRSDMGGGRTGLGLHESHGVHVEAFLDGLDNFDGSTITTGLNYGLYDGAFRKDHAAALVYFDNRWTHGLRPEPGRWRQTLPLMLVTEDLPSDANRVAVDSQGQAKVIYTSASTYARDGMDKALARLPDLLAPLPVEKIIFRRVRPTESHLQGTLRMGRDPKTSVIDPNQIHHRWRNLVVVGSSTFASCSCANPSLTVAALSLRAASQLA